MNEELLDYRLKLLEQQNTTIIKSLDKLEENLPKQFVEVKLYNEQVGNIEEDMKEIKYYVDEIKKDRNTMVYSALCGVATLLVSIFKAVLF